MAVVRGIFDNKMHVLDEHVAKHHYENNDKTFMELLKVASLCNQANFDNTTLTPGAERKVIGNASDCALLSFSESEFIYLVKRLH